MEKKNGITKSKEFFFHKRYYKTEIYFKVKFYSVF